MQFTINIPVIEAYVRAEFLNQHNVTSKGEFWETQIFAVSSIPGQTPLFHCMLDDGGINWRVPVHAFCQRPDVAVQELDELVLWDSFSYNVCVITIDLLKNKRMEYIGRDKTKYRGRYLFTLDWAGDDNMSHGFAETPGQHKCGHVIALDNGNFAIQPNNRLRVYDPNFVTNDQIYPRKLTRDLYSAEHTSKWHTADSSDYEYDIIERASEKS